MKPLRVLHCPTSTGGNPNSLARAERELGLNSVCVVMGENPFDYPADIVLLKKGEHAWRMELRRWALLWKSMRSFDVFHFNFGRSILPSWIRPVGEDRTHGRILPRLWSVYARALHMRDLPLLKELGKGIVMTYQGDDARQGDFCLKHFDISIAAEVDPGYYTPLSDHRARLSIEWVSRHADRIYALNPDLMHVLPRNARFLPYANIDIREWNPPRESMKNPVPVVIHAPSRRKVKGTRFILEAIERLRQDNVPLEFVLVENMSQAEARKLYERADLVVDQLLAGWYGGLAVEAWALAKPVICYIRHGDLKFIPADMARELPVIEATPRTIYEVLKTWLTDRRGDLAEMGHRGRAYVERWHNSLSIAARLKADYERIMAV